MCNFLFFGYIKVCNIGKINFRRNNKSVVIIFIINVFEEDRLKFYFFVCYVVFCGIFCVFLCLYFFLLLVYFRLICLVMRIVWGVY